MVETKRPRGRPRKHPLPQRVTYDELVTPVESKTIAPDWTPEKGMEPVPLDQAYPISEPLVALGDEPISVVVHFRVALSQPGVEELVEWPRGWPIPQAGDEVWIGTQHGFVSHIRFGLDDKALHVMTR